MNVTSTYAIPMPNATIPSEVTAAYAAKDLLETVNLAPTLTNVKTKIVAMIMHHVIIQSDLTLVSVKLDIPVMVITAMMSTNVKPTLTTVIKTGIAITSSADLNVHVMMDSMVMV